MIHLIRKYLRVKILLALIVLVTLIMGITIYMNIHSQEKALFKKVHEFGLDIARLAYASIKRPMARGKSKMVEEQLMYIKESMKNVEAYICDFNKNIIYASRPKAVNLSISKFIFNENAIKYLEDMLETGHAPSMAFEEKMSEPSLTVLLPILNEKRCYHCHGSSRKVLGGLVVKQSIAGIHNTIHGLRNHNLLIGASGILFLICLGYFSALKWISKPTRELAEKTARVAEGDFSVSMTTDREDSIGVLIKNFNIMTQKIKDQIEYANSLKFSISEPFFITDPNFTITYMNEALEALTGYGKFEAEGKKKCYEIIKSELCNTDCFFKKALEGSGTIMSRKATIKQMDGKEVPVITSGAPLRDSTGKIWGGFHFIRDITLEVEAEKAIKEAAAKEEAQRLYLEKRVKKLVDLFGKIAQGDLTERAEIEGKEDMMDRLAQHINQMLDNVSKIIQQAKEEALSVAERASEISANNQELSERTQKQAVSVEEVSAAIQEMTAIINQNAENTAKVNELAKWAVDAAKEGGKVAMDAISSIERIEKTSNRISEIINLVNEITFQTKLLSLNAAVEAARAGEQGKGFAVIGAEIRDLAIRSTEAAKDIRVLIEESGAKVSEGINFVNSTAENLQKIIDHITKVSKLIAEIASASKQQTEGIEQTNKTVMEINKVVQQNAAFVEELTSASEKLSSEADILLELTRGFITSEVSHKEAQMNESLAEQLVKKAEPKETAVSPPDLDLEDKFEEF